MQVPGTIDLYNRPVRHNEDGSISTVRSTAFTLDDGSVILIPTISPSGQEWTPEQALDYAKKTGQHLGIYDNEEEADAAAEQIHQQQAIMYDPENQNDVRHISYGDPMRSPEEQSQFGSGLVSGFLKGITELPLAAAEKLGMLGEMNDYQPGELAPRQSGLRQRVKTEQRNIEEFMQDIESTPAGKQGAFLGEGSTMVIDPVLDTGFAAAPFALKGLKVLAHGIESGRAAEAAGTVLNRLAHSERGAVELPTLSHGQLRFMRGGRGQDLNVPAGMQMLPVDSVPSVQQAVTKAENMRWLEPEIVSVEQGKSPLRYSPDYAVADTEKTGAKEFLGNEKMRQGNPSWPKGRQTVDYRGCGRGKFCTENKLLADACYATSGDPACYAAAEAKRYGREVTQTSFEPMKPSDPLMPEIRQAVEDFGADAVAELYPGHIIKEYTELPKTQAHNIKKINESIDKVGLEKTREKFPNFIIKGKDKVGKVTVRERPVMEGARVTADIKPGSMKGEDLRLGVDSDGGAWLSNPKVMDSVLAADPKIVSVYSSGYHKPPPPHPLSRRSIINVTVSGWHPLPETIKRIEWARQARANGWNVILREVTADPKLFGKEIDKATGVSKVDRYNRTHDMIRNTDFYVMEQPLHEGSRYGGPIDDKMPSCCKSGDCSGCRVAEGTGKEFQDYWDLKEDQPLFKDYPDWTKERDKLDALLQKPKTEEPPPLDYDLSNSGKTQIATTVPTYKKVKEKLFPDAGPGEILDYGAGMGKGAEAIGAETLEPFAKDWNPNYTDAGQIKKQYKGIINNAVLNVLPKPQRDAVVKDIGSKLTPGGKAFINVRGKDVFNAKVAQQISDSEIITSKGTFQKAFTKHELIQYLKDVLGDGFKVEGSPLGTIGAVITRRR